MLLSQHALLATAAALLTVLLTEGHQTLPSWLRQLQALRRGCPQTHHVPHHIRRQLQKHEQLERLREIYHRFLPCNQAPGEGDAGDPHPVRTALRVPARSVTAAASVLADMAA